MTAQACAVEMQPVSCVHVAATTCIKSSHNFAGVQVQTTCWTEMAVAPHHLHRRHVKKHISR